MSDLVAERLDADIILPASSGKPEYKGKPTLLKWLTGSARTFRGPVMLGRRECVSSFARRHRRGPARLLGQTYPVAKHGLVDWTRYPWA